VDVRVIATTNRDLPAEVARGAFRQDLYFRLNVLPVTMPPLKGIIEELDDLLEHFLRQVAAREGKPVKLIEPRVLDLMRAYPWPGNVRELQNLCERAAVLTTGDEVKAALIEPWLTAPTGAPGRPASMIEPAPLHGAPGPGLGVICDGRLTLEDVERESIVATLRENHGHRQRSAAALGIGVRTLGLKLKKWKEQQIVSETL
jgi:DNA-binding NtrC family response regulator